MFQLTINEKGGPARQETFDKAEITIGRVQGNDVILPKGNISKRHSRIVVKDGKFIIVDLKSTNGTYVNGKKISAPQVVKATDKIYIGDFTIQIGANGAAGAVAPEPREPSVRARPQREEEIDLFGGDAEVDVRDGGPRSGGGAPGLIDDNFDQEFEVPAVEPPQPKLPKASKRLPKPVEPEPQFEPEPEPEPEPEAALELDEDFGDPGPASEPAFALPPAPDPDPEPEPEPELEPAPEPEPRPALALKGAKRAATAAAQSRSQPSRVRALPGRAKQEAREELEELDVGMGPGLELDRAPAGRESAAPTALPQPAVARLELHAEPSAEAGRPPAPALAQPAVGVIAAPSAPALDRATALRKLHLEVVDAIHLRGVALADLGAHLEVVREAARVAAERMRRSGQLDASEPVDAVAREVAAAAADLGPLADLIADESVVELSVSSDRQVLVDREGRLEPTGRTLPSEGDVIRLVRLLGVLGGGDPGAQAPLLDVRLRDGSRVVAALPPLAFRGPTLTLRKTTRDFFTLDKLLEYNTLSAQMLTFVDYCVRFRKNLLLVTGPGVNATATLNAVMAQMPSDDRVVAIENGVELHLAQSRNLTSLEPRDGIGVSALLAHAISMQADRLLVGGLGGAAAREVLQAISGPTEGSVVACSATSPHEALDRITKVELASLFESRPDEARRMVAQAFPVVLHEQRFLDNSRRITSISEVILEDGELRLEDVFVFQAEGVDENLLVTGSFKATGHTPRFLEELVDRGEAEVDMEIFKS